MGTGKVLKNHTFRRARSHFRRRESHLSRVGKWNLPSAPRPLQVAPICMHQGTHTPPQTPVQVPVQLDPRCHGVTTQLVLVLPPLPLQCRRCILNNSRDSRAAHALRNPTSRTASRLRRYGYMGCEIVKEQDVQYCSPSATLLWPFWMIGGTTV